MASPCKMVSKIIWPFLSLPSQQTFAISQEEQSSDCSCFVHERTNTAYSPVRPSSELKP